MDTSFLHGLFPALVTPFKEDESLNEEVLAGLVERLVRQDADGLYVCGSSGEAMLLSLPERKRVLEVAVEAANNRIPIVAHIGCQSTTDTIELARHAQRQGARAISALPPIYYKYTIEELSNYYCEIMNAVNLPFVVYNAPSLTGVFFDRSNIAEVFEHPNASGMKFTSYDSYKMQRLISQYPDKIMFNGHDETYLTALALGVNRAIGSTLNFTLVNFRQVLMHFKAGDLKAARQGQDGINAIVDALVNVGVFRGIKGVLNLLGVPVGNCRRPFAPMSRQEMKRLEEILPLIAGY